MADGDGKDEDKVQEATGDECALAIVEVMELATRWEIAKEWHISIGMCNCFHMHGHVTHRRSDTKIPFMLMSQSAVVHAVDAVKRLLKMTASGVTVASLINACEVADDPLEDREGPFDGVSFTLPDPIFDPNRSSN